MNMKKALFKLTFTFSLFLLFTTGLIAQVTTSGITGKVTGAGNEPLPGERLLLFTRLPELRRA